MRLGAGGTQQRRCEFILCAVRQRTRLVPGFASARTRSGSSHFVACGTRGEEFSVICVAHGSGAAPIEDVDLSRLLWGS